MAHRSRAGSDLLTSPANPAIKRIRSLQQRKFRLRERAFVVEGVRAVNDILEAGIMPDSIILREYTEFEVPDDLFPVIRRVSANVFEELTDVAHPQGVLAVVPMLEEPALPEVSTNPLVVYLDGVRDPGNMGTLFRSAAGAGVDHLVIGPDSVDPYHPKAVRAAMGSHLRIRFSHVEFEEFRDYSRDFPVIALADAGGNALYDSVNWQLASVMIVGGEAFGPTSAAREIANVIVSIPLANGVESLNAGVAGSLLMFEAARQRKGSLAT